jgi:cytoskeletal protein CcmA (bactofilin family)
LRDAATARSHSSERKGGGVALFGQDEKTREGRPATAPAPAAESRPSAPAPAPATAAAAAPAKPAIATLRDVVSGGEPRGEATATIGRGSKISGKLHFDGTVRVEGSIDGEISAQGTMQIGERAVVNAQIAAAVVVIRGHVNGDVRARKRVEIHAPGKLRGNIFTPSLVIEEGVMFEGRCSMAPSEGA